MTAERAFPGLSAIDQVVLRHVRMQLRHPFVTALGVEHTRDIVLVEVHADGVIGYGEVPVLAEPTYNEETVVTAWHVLNDFFIPRALFRPGEATSGTTKVTPQIVAHRMGVFKGHAFAKAGLEAAVWDATAKAAGLSLNELLYRASATGKSPSSTKVGKTAPRSRIPSGVVVGMAPRDDEGHFLQQIQSRLDEGYQRIKVKIEPGRDRAPIAAVRRAFGPIPLSADANGTYRLADAAALRSLDEFELSYIEQPLPSPDFIDHATLQGQLQTPLCLDESVSDIGQLRQALDQDGCRVVNVKASRVGGLTEAVAMHDACLLRGVPVLCGGLLESGIGRAHNVALASLPGFTLPGDVSASARYWKRDVVHPEFVLDEDGYIAVPTGPGIGVEVDDAFVQSLTVRVRIHRSD